MIKILVLRGDGIGPEIVDQAMRVLSYLKEKYNLDLNVSYAHFGGSAIDRLGHPFPKETLDQVDQADVILLGAIGGPKWDHEQVRPEDALLALRKHLNTYCNLRPIKTFKALMPYVPVKLKAPVDLCFVRELTGGIYFGEKGIDVNCAYDRKAYNKVEIKRITQKAIGVASKRSKKITSIDKSNVLATSKLWRRQVTDLVVGLDIECHHMYVDNAAMQLILKPDQFDVILTSNMFGDILSDEASVLAGSIGVLPSASIGDKQAIYEPIHGSAPDIEGQGIANPIGMIRSVGMMFEYTLNRRDISLILDEAIEATLGKGFGTPDLNLLKSLSSSEWTTRLIEQLKSL